MHLWLRLRLRHELEVSFPVISRSAPINKPRADNCICDQRHVGRDSGVAPTPAHGEAETHDIKLKYTTHIAL